jgi:hypothetical protein
LLMKVNKRLPMTLKEAHERVQGFLAVRKEQENRNPQHTGGANKRVLPWSNPAPNNKRNSNGIRFGFPQNSMSQPRPASFLGQLSGWKDALDAVSPTEDQAGTVAQLTQQDAVSSLLGSLQTALINQQAPRQAEQNSMISPLGRNQALSFLQTLTQQASPQQPVASGAQLLPGQCRDFFVRGNCTHGQTCKFSHSLTGAPPNTKMAPKPCFDFMRNSCHRGASCKFAHDVPTGAVGGVTCKKCNSPDHLYGHKCPKYSGCYRCGNPAHMATGCILACFSCGSEPGKRCDPNQCEAAARVFRRGPPPRGGR